MKRIVALLMFAGYVALVTGCNQGSTENYQFFKDNPDEARSVIGDCRLNGTRGMDAKRNAICDAAVAADKSTRYEAANKSN